VKTVLQIGYNHEESRVSLGFFERGDDENKVSAEKCLKINF